MRNLDVRITVSESGLTYKRIAEEMGISPEWLCKLMGKDLSPNNRIRILTAIDRIRGREAEGCDI